MIAPATQRQEIPVVTDDVAALLAVFDAVLDLAKQHAALRAKIVDVSGSPCEIVFLADRHPMAEYAAMVWAATHAFSVEDRIWDYPDMTIRALRVRFEDKTIIRVQWPHEPKRTAARPEGWSL